MRIYEQLDSKTTIVWDINGTFSEPLIGHCLCILLNLNLEPFFTIVFIFQSGDVSVFETNIRYVGGLLSAYALTGDKLFLDKASHVADKLMPAFKSPTGIPFALINMRTGVSNFGCF